MPLPAFRSSWPLIGVVHLPALPGSPDSRLPMADVLAHAEADARTLLAAGFDGLVVENFGDHPFFPDAVEPHTIAAMTLVTARLVALAGGRAAVGVNVLRNDARSAVGIAAMCGAAFVRVNVHVGAMVTDQGLLQGRAHETLRYRRSLDSSVAVFADVLVKHASPLGDGDAETLARDTVHRGGAAALIVSGAGTGRPADLDRAARVRAAVPGTRVLLGSGVTLESLPASVAAAGGAIVGTSIKRHGRIEEPVDEGRARALVARRDDLIGTI